MGKGGLNVGWAVGIGVECGIILYFLNAYVLLCVYIYEYIYVQTMKHSLFIVTECINIYVQNIYIFFSLSAEIVFCHYEPMYGSCSFMVVAQKMFVTFDDT